MITKVILTRIYISDKSKAGVPFVSKTGKPYKKIAIKTVEHGDTWLSGFVNKTNEFWKEGDQVDIIIKQNGDYLNFETVKEEDKIKEKVAALEVEVLNLKNAVAKLTPKTVTTTKTPTQPHTESAPSSGPDDFGVPEMDEPDF